MTTQLTAAGLLVDTFEEVLEAIETEQKADISPTLDLSTSSPLGQLNRVVARAITLVNESLEALYAGLDPDSNAGDIQDRVAALTGTYREAATKATVTLDVDLDAGTYAIGSLVAHPAGRPQDRFVNVNEVISAGGSNVEPFEAEEAGLLQAPVGGAGTYVIAGPVAGWNSIDSATEGSAGADAETDAAFRLRRTIELQSPGSTSAAGIAADISSNVPDVTSVFVVENDTSTVVDSIPPHSIEAVVFGPASPGASDNLAVANQIFESKAAGIGTYGNTAVSVVDSQGFTKVINFTRPAAVTVDVDIEITTAATSYEGDQEVIDLVTANIQALPPGDDVTWADVASWIMSIRGVNRVTVLNIDGAGTTDKVITSREKAQPGSITVSDSSPGDP